MFQYVTKRLLHIVGVLLVVTAVIFLITQVLPGDAAQMILGEHATPGQLAALRERMGLNEPVLEQFRTWISGALVGDLGTSISTGAPVRTLVLDAMGRSAILGLFSLVLVSVISIPLGVLAAAQRGRLTDLVISIGTYAGTALPEFVIATLLLVLFAGAGMGLPTGGFASIGDAGFWGFVSYLVLPVMTLAIVMTAHISRQTRSEMVEVLESDYIRTARIKGLSGRTVLFRHALPNSLLPAITIIALDVGYLIGGIVVVEEVFAFPGIGRLLIFAIENRDIPLLQGVTLLISAIYALANLLADISYALLDRRISYD